MSCDHNGQVLVVCTFRNAQKTLGDTLISLVEQRCRNFVCALVDDQSTDQSLEHALKVAENDDRFRVVTNPQPGRGSALNLALSLGNEPFVAVLDADDVAHPYWLERAVNAMDEDNRYAVIGCESVLFSDGETMKWPTDKEIATCPQSRDVTLALTRSNPIGHSGAIIRRKALESVGGYKASRKSQFDYDLWVRIAANGGRLGKIETPLIGKRLHTGQHFERSNHFRYVLRSLHVQYRAIRCLGARPTEYLWLGARVMWGLLPRWVRVAGRRLARKRGHESDWGEGHGYH